MSTQPRPRMLTLDEYLAAEERSEFRSEYVDGQVLAMVGGSINHGVIAQNLATALGTRLRGRGCRVVSQGTKVKVNRTENVFYPDVVVFCGPPEVERRRGELLTNPVLLAEVLSPSTSSYDHVKKWENYRLVTSMQDYLLISQDEPRVERYTRQGEAVWLFSEVMGLDAVLTLESVGATISLAEIYEGVLSPGGAAAEATREPSQ